MTCFTQSILDRGAAEAFAKLGASIAVADINEELAKEVANAINERSPGKALALRVDVSIEESVKAAVEATISHFGRIGETSLRAHFPCISANALQTKDYCINSAGLVVGGHSVTNIKGTALSDYERIQAVDARGVFLSMKYQIAAMLAQDIPDRPRASRGVIVNISSRAGLEGVVSCDKAYSAQ